MSRARSIIVAAFVAAAMVLPSMAHAQMLGGAPGPGNNQMSMHALEQAGPGSLKRGAKSADDQIRDAKRKFNDADPRVRVEGLEGLRYVDSKDANGSSFAEFPIPTCACASRRSMSSARAAHPMRFR